MRLALESILRPNVTTRLATSLAGGFEHRSSPWARALTASAAAAGLALAAHAGCFVQGELFLITSAAPNPASPGQSIPAVLRIDPSTGAVTMLAQLPGGLTSRAATYDPFRDRLLAYAGSPATGLKQIDAGGSIDILPTAFGQTIIDVAPTGDGRIYLLGTSTIGWLDAFGTTHPLLADDGVTEFSITLLGGTGTMIYDFVGNALIVADSSPPDTRVRRVPLSGDGTRVQGPVESAFADGSSLGGEVPVGFSAMPDGNLFLKIDDNSNSLQPRMQVVDPTTLAAAPFAWSEYFGVGGEVAGAFSVVQGKGVVLDSLGDILRTFAPGSSGAGAVFASNVSVGGSSGELARLVEIGGTIGGGGSARAGDLDGNGVIGGADLGLLLGAWGPCADCGDCPADLDGDCAVGGADLGLLLGSWTGC